MKTRNRWLTVLLLLTLGGAVLWLGVYGLWGETVRNQVGALTSELAGTDNHPAAPVDRAPHPTRTEPLTVATETPKGSILAPPVERPAQIASEEGAAIFANQSSATSSQSRAPAMAITRSEVAAAASAAPFSPRRDLADYLVKLQAEQPLRHPGTPGELRVVISAPESSPDSPAGWAEASRSIRTAGESAEVEPYAPDFEIISEPKICMALDPSGSTARFTIIPRKTGPLKVGATVRLYNLPDCQGTPTIKQPENLEVVVVVDWLAWLKQRGLELWQIFWEKLLEFWGLALGVLSGLLLFLFRRRLKRLFGYGGES